MRALVIGGGGILASSWATGLITGMAEAGVDVRDADVIIGTSSGARVALQLASGDPLEEVFTRHLGAGGGMARDTSGIDWGRVQDEVASAKKSGAPREEILKRYGALALELGGPDRRAEVAKQLPMQQWPERVRMVALNAKTGVRRVFDRSSGIELVDAFMATTASFGAAPVWFEGQPYIDGGYHSGDNADLAAGASRALVLTLKVPPWAMRLVSVEDGIAELKASGTEVELIQPDEEVMQVLRSSDPTVPNAFDPLTRAGRAQGRRVVEQRAATSWWHYN